MTWRRGIKKLTSALVLVGASSLPGWDARVEGSYWLETLRDMVQNLNQWRECCNGLSAELVPLKNTENTRKITKYLR